MVVALEVRAMVLASVSGMRILIPARLVPVPTSLAFMVAPLMVKPESVVTPIDLPSSLFHILIPRILILPVVDPRAPAISAMVVMPEV